jgi:hypothetical protein
MCVEYTGVIRKSAVKVKADQNMFGSLPGTYFVLSVPSHQMLLTGCAMYHFI